MFQQVVGRLLTATIWDFGKNLQAVMGNAPVWQAKILARGLPAFLLKKMMEQNEDGVARAELLVAYSSQSCSLTFSYLSETWCVPFGSKVDSPSIHSSRGHLTALALSPDGTRAAAGSNSGSLDILDTTVPTLRWDEVTKRDFATPLHSVTSVATSPDGSRFLIYSGLVWHLTDAYCHVLSKVDFGIADYARTEDVPRPVFSADSRTFAWSMSDFWDRQDKSSVRVYESTTGTQKSRFSGVKKIQVFVISPDGSFIGCGHESAITLCDVGMQIKRALIVANDVSITTLAFSSDSQTLMSGSGAGVIQL
ncbi:hypothetical protein JVU11DRAFT_7779 [Chiua virens]|nr:hypothetical protein JVU11DRAFT_7779 [Chiua virens]